MLVVTVAGLIVAIVGMIHTGAFDLNGRMRNAEQLMDVGICLAD